MPVLNGEPGPTGVSTDPLSNLYVPALDGDGLRQIAGYDGSFAETGPWPPGARSESYGPVAGEQAGPKTAPSWDRPAASLPKTWPGGVGEVFETARRGQPTRPAGPVQFVLKLLEHWRLERGHAVALLGFNQPDADYVHSVLEGRERLRGKDTRDRIVHLYGVRRSLWSLFRDLETENSWLREPHEKLDGKSPMSLMLSGSMENLLAVKDYVDTFAGR